MEPLAPTLRAVAADWLKKTEPASVPVVLWPLICGASIASRTQALSFIDGTLLISVPDRHWIDQLREFIPQYLATMNEVAPLKVKYIEFRVNA
jgi:hypothetical protein